MTKKQRKTVRRIVKRALRCDRRAARLDALEQQLVELQFAAALRDRLLRDKP